MNQIAKMKIFDIYNRKVKFEVDGDTDGKLKKTKPY